MMPYLDAALAFALTMLVVATLVTQIVRLVTNTANVRRDGLKRMLTEYFDLEFKPVVERELSRLKDAVGTNVITGLTGALNQDTSSAQTKNAEIENAEDKKLVDLPTDELIERLKRSAFGQKLLADLGNNAQAVFDELGTRYEAVGRKFTESFRANSRKWTTAIALVLAVVINIDSIHIVNAFIGNEGMRQAVIAQRDAFVKDYTTLAKTLEQEEAKQAQILFTRADLEKAFKDSRAPFDVLPGAGVPVGWSYFPHSYFQGEHGTSKDFQNRNTFGGWLMWVLGILITGGLAGLGGPFWYDAVAGISRAVQGTRAAGKRP